MQDKHLIVVSILFASAISALLGGVVAYRISGQKAVLQMSGAIVKLHGVNIVDESGRVCLTLSATDGVPTVNFLGIDGKPRMTMTLNERGYSAVRLTNPNPSGPAASLEIDDKGTHVKFDRPGGASSYLFLNNSGGSGVVFLDPTGTRKLELMVSPSGQTDFRRYDQPSPK